MSQTTSTEAYELLKSRGILGALQLAVFRALESGALTDHEIAKQIAKPRDTASPRVRELIRLGIVQEVGERECAITGFRCRTVGLTGKVQDGRLPSSFKTCTTSRIPRAILKEALDGVDALLACLLLDSGQRAAGNNARRILSEHL